MSRLPTFANWARDESSVDRYLAGLDTLDLDEMPPEALEALASYLFQAARNKVVSAISYASLASRRASDDPDAHEETRQLFLDEARMFQTAARHYRDIHKKRKG